MGRIFVSRCTTTVLVLLSLSLTSVQGDEMQDVKERDDVLLECRFGSHLSLRQPSFYWTRSNSKDKDLVAIKETLHEENYEISYASNEGKYDLRICNASYDRDNGKFECRVKEKGSGLTLYSKTIQLTVLLPPGPPKITPLNPSATEGRPFELACSSSGGSPDPLIRWHRNGIPLDSLIKFGGGRNNPTSAILSVTPQRDDDGAEYKCAVWNRAMGEGKKLESSVKLSVNYYPRVNVGPESPLRVEMGTPAKLLCTVDSKPAVSSVKWTKNGKIIASSFTYGIPQISFEDAGSYACTADNGFGQSSESALNLEVLYAPIVSVTPKKEVEEGESVWIKCNVSSNPRPSSIEWIKKEDPTFRQSGDILRIERASAQNSGTYICKAVNVLNPSGQNETYERTGNASVSLYIKHAPGKAFIEPVNPSVVEGSSLTLTCKANPAGLPQPQYRWWRESSENTISIGAELNLARVKESYEGRYFCEPTNELGTGTVASTELKVFQPPKIVQALRSQVIRKAGDSGFKVTCTTKSKPQSTVTWIKDGEVLNQKDGLYKIESQSMEIKNGVHTVNSTLHFDGDLRDGLDKMMAKDRGYFTCVFENEASKAESQMLLRVQHKPVFIPEVNRNLVAFDFGDVAHIPCKVRAFPKPEFDWSFNFLKKGGGIGGMLSYEQNFSSLTNDVYLSTLIIPGIQEKDFGEYSCRASNSLGNSSIVIALRPKSKPEVPTKLEIIASSVDSVLLKYEAGFNGGFEETRHTVQYFGDGSIVEVECALMNPCNISGLQQHILYTFRVKARNPKGESDFSRNITAMTLIDFSKIPSPRDVIFEPLSKTLVFNVLEQKPKQIAKVEVQQEDSIWKVYRMFPILTENNYHVIEDFINIESVRVSLCFKDENTCGISITARLVSTIPATDSVATRVFLIGAIVFAIVFLICPAFLVLFCFCRQIETWKTKENHFISKQNYSSKITQLASPPYYKAAIEKNVNEQNDCISYGEIFQSYNQFKNLRNANPNPDFNNKDYSTINWNYAGPVATNEQLLQNQLNYSNPVQLRNRRSGNSDYFTNEYVPNDFKENIYVAILKPNRRLNFADEFFSTALNGLSDAYKDPRESGMGFSDESVRVEKPTTTAEPMELDNSFPNSKRRKIIREVIV